MMKRIEYLEFTSVGRSQREATYRYAALAPPTSALIILLMLSCWIAFDASTLSAAQADVPAAQQDEADALQAAKDLRTVETLLRLPGFDIQGKPEIKASLDRYLRTVASKKEFVDIVQQLQYVDAAPELLAIAQQAPEQPVAVQAVRTLLKLRQGKLIEQFLNSPAEENSGKVIPKDPESLTPMMATIQVLGRVGNRRTVGWLVDIIDDSSRPASLRTQTVRSLAASSLGEQELLKRIEDGSLDDALKFVASDVLHASRDTSIRNRIEQLLPLPAGVDSAPLPPIADLISRQGDAEQGKVVFFGVGTCQKCHKVRGEGKEIGPDLSEIGSKLSPTAMFESILDPSAAISHNYESYLVSTVDGTVITGLMISETENQIVLKDAESIVHTLQRDDIEDLLKQNVSLMPVGLQKEMTVEQLVDLVAYLSTLTKQGE